MKLLSTTIDYVIQKLINIFKISRQEAEECINWKLTVPSQKLYFDIISFNNIIKEKYNLKNEEHYNQFIEKKFGESAMKFINELTY